MDERFLKEDGLEVFTGNELIFKGALEAGVSLITGYPGSPVSDVFDIAGANSELLKKHGIVADMANNEALSVARLNGARQAGARAMAVMKSVGLHVAADGLALGNLAEPRNKGGSIVVVGDDPWIDSTQINNDSRFLSQHLHMPVLEPSTFQEVKDWLAVAFELSSAANLYLTYLMTTHQADGGGTVWVHPNRYPRTNALQPVTLKTEAFRPDDTVLLPPRTWAREATLPQRLQTLLQEARHYGINRLLMPSTAPTGAQRWPLGLVASGMPYCYLEHALLEMGLSGQIPILKLGLSYPIDTEAVLTFAGQVDQIYVIEEKRGFIEHQISQVLFEAHQSGQFRSLPSVWGKTFPNGHPGLPEARGLNAPLVAHHLTPIFLEQLNLPDTVRARLRGEEAIWEATASTTVQLPARTPTFCPGCPHRDSSSVLLEVKRDFNDPAYMKRIHHRDPVDIVFHGETGCFTMLMFEPNAALMHNYSGMGLGGGTGAGMDPFITNKQVVFLGDSTFFHSGMIAISDSIKNHQDITYIILDNKTTAMTGHQPTPGTETNLMGDPTFAQNIETILQGMSQNSDIPVIRVNPAYRENYRSLLEETILQEGVKVIIADKECGLTYQRRVRKETKALLRREGYLPEERHISISPEACEFCLECTITTGCPGLTIEQTLYGPKIATDLTHCVSDGACAKIKACPAFEEVIIHRQKPVPARPALPTIDKLPLPSMPEWDLSWNIYTAGVGGMGAGLISAILVSAAHRQGYRVLFSDKKGLAVRNGGVYGHIIIARDKCIYSPVVPYGKADLVLGIDLLEAARSLDPSTHLRVIHSARTHAIINSALNPTIGMLMGKDSPHPDQWLNALQGSIRPERYWAQDVSRIAEYYFGSKLYTNMILLGAAFQRGTLPLSLEHLEAAIAQLVPRDDRPINLEAFRAGRALAVIPESFLFAENSPSYKSLLQTRIRFLERLYGKTVAHDYRGIVEEAVLELGLDEDTHIQLAQQVYDLVCYENIAYARHYLRLVLQTFRRDRASWHWRATQAVLKNAFKVMAIKDEVYVAHLLTSPQKQERDRMRFRVEKTRGDRLEIRHFNRPEFVIFGKRLRWDMDSRNWQLHIVKRLKFLRRWLKDWHRDEKAFRDWYLALVDRFDAETEEAYGLWVSIFSAPKHVRGYRDIRRPRMEQARRQAASALQTLARGDVSHKAFCDAALQKSEDH